MSPNTMTWGYRALTYWSLEDTNIWSIAGKFHVTWKKYQLFCIFPSPLFSSNPTLAWTWVFSFILIAARFLSTSCFNMTVLLFHNVFFLECYFLSFYLWDVTSFGSLPLSAFPYQLLQDPLLSPMIKNLGKSIRSPSTLCFNDYVPV